jgi:hypothetical protein
LLSLCYSLIYFEWIVSLRCSFDSDQDAAAKLLNKESPLKVSGTSVSAQSSYIAHSQIDSPKKKKNTRKSKDEEEEKTIEGDPFLYFYPLFLC